MHKKILSWAFGALVGFILITSVLGSLPYLIDMVKNRNNNYITRYNYYVDKSLRFSIECVSKNHPLIFGHGDGNATLKFEKAFMCSETAMSLISSLKLGAIKIGRWQENGREVIGVASTRKF